MDPNYDDMKLSNVEAAISAESKKAPGTIDFNYVQKLYMKARQLIEQDLEDNSTRKNIQEKLNAMYRNYQELDKILKHTASKNNTPKTLNKTRKSQLRKRVNPEFGRLGIPIPVGQRPGDEVVELGVKIKKDRRRKTRRSR
jgi:hypothetical protein